MSTPSDPPPYYYPTHLNALDIPPSYDVEAAKAAIDNLTPEEREKYEEGLAKAMSAADLEPALKDSAAFATTACKNIEDMFISLSETLTSIDAKHTPQGQQGFAPRLGQIQQRYRDTLWDSQKLALDIAHYAEKFDDLIIPYCADKDLPVEKRLKKINQFVADAEGFHIAAHEMSSRFDDLIGKFAVFVGEFGHWAKDKGQKNEEEIDRLQEEIKDLLVELQKLKDALNYLSIALAATLPVFALLSIFSGPFAPLVLSAAAVLAGLELGSVVGLAVAITDTQNKIDGKNRAVENLQKENETLRATRAQLEETGKKDLEIFKTNIKGLAMVWKAARSDAYQVKQWLEEGASDIDTPKYMLVSVGKAVGVYSVMAKYLKGYASGIVSLDIPK